MEAEGKTDIVNEGSDILMTEIEDIFVGQIQL
jgi:hypothetical protein